MENENENERVELKKVLANTLQGRIYLAIDRSNKQWIVVKETWKELVKLGTSRDGHRVPENFLKELEIHKYLSLLNDADEGFTRVITSWQDDQCYFVASEFCNRGLFDYIKEIHTKGDMAEYARQQSLKEQKALLKPNQWIGMAQDMFKQCVRCVSWMHSKGICHLDLSLENTMLMSPKKGSSTPLVKIIDFGLAQRFKNDNYFHDQRVGKTGYMAPEVYSKQNYDARFADIWSLGVMLFMMLIGAPPYEFPHKNNPAFNFIINGRLADVLIHWKRLRLVTKDALDLMTQIFRPEKDRINMSKIRQHPFVALDNHNEEKNHDDNNDGGNNANNGGNVNNNGNCNNNNNDNDNCNNDNCNNNNNNNNDE